MELHMGYMGSTIWADKWSGVDFVSPPDRETHPNSAFQPQAHQNRICAISTSVLRNEALTFSLAHLEAKCHTSKESAIAMELTTRPLADTHTTL